MQQRSIILTSVIASALVAGIWAFPSLWYTQSPSGQFLWFSENTNVTGWTYTATPVEKFQEAGLDADATVCGQFEKGRDTVQVFAANRFSENPNEIGLFVHTPDRCWTESGWKLKAVTPDWVEFDLHGAKCQMERRVFVWSSGEEILVYFGGLSGGHALPYRLDHNLSIGQKQQINSGSTAVGVKSRAVDSRFWGRIWDTFQSRRQNAGPKQFIRVATPVKGDLGTADARLTALLGQWFKPSDFKAEMESWRLKGGKKKAENPGGRH